MNYGQAWGGRGFVPCATRLLSTHCVPQCTAGTGSVKGVRGTCRDVGALEDEGHGTGMRERRRKGAVGESAGFLGDHARLEGRPLLRALEAVCP